MGYILVVGAKSDIAKAIVEEFAKDKYNFYLAGRNIQELENFCRHLKVKYNVEAILKELDITDVCNHENFYNSLDPKPIGVIVAVGYLPDQKKAELDLEETIKTIRVNYEGIVCFLNIVANDFERRGEGFIIGISSVAGDRGRKKNYIYGSAKAGFSEYLSGLRNRLYSKGIHVMTVKPGFVYTKMTQHMELPKLLTATPEEVARDIYKAFKNKKDVVYTKWYWRIIMTVIKHIPEFIFKRLDL